MEKEQEQLKQFIDDVKNLIDSNNSDKFLHITSKKDLEEAGTHALFFLTLLNKAQELNEKSQKELWDSIQNEVKQFLVLSQELLLLNIQKG